MIDWTPEVSALAGLLFSKFPNLTEAELRLLCAVTTGELADCSPDSPERPLPPNAIAEGDEQNNIRASIIRSLCVDREVVEWVDPRGIRIRGARIIARLDLANTTVRYPIEFVECRFTDSINLSSAQIERIVLKATSTRDIRAYGLAVHSDLLLIECQIAAGADLLGATVGGKLDCTRTAFESDSENWSLRASKIRVGGSVFLREGSAGGVTMFGSDIGGDLECWGGHFRVGHFADDCLNAGRIRTAGNVFLGNGFDAEGRVTLQGASIAGDLYVQRARFRGPESGLFVQRARVEGRFYCREVHFGDGAELNLSDAQVGSIIDEQSAWPRLAGC
jgi:hypothetical protein